MIGDEAKTAPLVPARAIQGANDVNRPVGVVHEALIRSEFMVSALVTASRQETGFGLHTCLAQTGQVAVTHLVASKTLPMWKPPTGEPYAGKPPVRFGGRGGRKPFPAPIQKNTCVSGLRQTETKRLFLGCLRSPAGGREKTQSYQAVCSRLRHFSHQPITRTSAAPAAAAT